MESVQNSFSMLCMFTHPVFVVKDGIIVAMNQPAKDLQIMENTTIFDLLLSDSQQYRDFTDGSLSLTITIGPVAHIAAIVRVDGYDFFHLNCNGENSDLRSLSLASQHLRDPLSNVIALTDLLFTQYSDVANEKLQQRVAQLNQNLYRLLRCVGNMSDAHSCSNRTSGMEQRNISAIFSEAVQTAQQQLLSQKRKIVYSAATENTVGLADADQLERAVYNLISNAVRHGDADTDISVTLRCENNRVHFAVENSCKAATPDLLGTIFFRYRRTPTVTDGGKGLGLGIPIVQAIASAHSGSLLVTMPKPGLIRFCLTIPIIADKAGNLRSPLLRPDYTGGYDRSLIELSDILPSSTYKK